MAQRKHIRLGTMGLRVQSLALLRGLRIWHCCELWRRSQTWLGSDVAVAVAGCYSSDWTHSLGTSMCHRSGPKKAEKKKGKDGHVREGGTFHLKGYEERNHGEMETAAAALAYSE